MINNNKKKNKKLELVIPPINDHKEREIDESSTSKKKPAPWHKLTKGDKLE